MPMIKHIGAMLLAVGMLAFSSPTVSARVICNQWGQCWRVHGDDYYSGWGWPDRQDRWHGEDEDDGNWGEHEGRGHWQWEED